jgi:hypothetical protein
MAGFVDIDIKQTVAGEWDPKLWVVKVRLVGYAQMDTQWHGQARNPNWQEKTRFETLPVFILEMLLTSRLKIVKSLYGRRMSRSMSNQASPIECVPFHFNYNYPRRNLSPRIMQRKDCF